MSATATLQPTVGPIRRALRRAWLRYRIREGAKDVQRLEDQAVRDIHQAQAYRNALAAWRVELSLHEETNR